MSRILLVDNIANDLEKTRRQLLHNNFDIISAIDAQEGLYKALAFNPHLIITELTQLGISGLEFCHRLKEHEITKNIPIIAYSSDNRDFEKILFSFIKKPCEPQRLICSAQIAIESSYHSSENRNDDFNFYLPTMGELLKILNFFRKQSILQLGSKQTFELLYATRPKKYWFTKFEISPVSDIRYSERIERNLNMQEIKLFQCWLRDFIFKCSENLEGFDSLLYSKNKNRPENISKLLDLLSSIENGPQTRG